MAFAIGRAIGSSVVRNRVRRRLRAVLSTQPAGQLPPGWYMIGARPGIVERSFAQLTRDVIELVAVVDRQLSPAAVDSSDS